MRDERRVARPGADARGTNAGKFNSRDKIFAPGMPRSALDEPPQGKKETKKQTVGLDGVAGIVRTSGTEAAAHRRVEGS